MTCRLHDSTAALTVLSTWLHQSWHADSMTPLQHWLLSAHDYTNHDMQTPWLHDSTAALTALSTWLTQIWNFRESVDSSDTHRRVLLNTTKWQRKKQGPRPHISTFVSNRAAEGPTFCKSRSGNIWLKSEHIFRCWKHYFLDFCRWFKTDLLYQKVSLQ